MAKLEFEYEGDKVALTSERRAERTLVRLASEAEYMVEDARMEDSIAVLVVTTRGGSGDGPEPKRVLRVPYARHGRNITLCWKGRVYTFVRSASRAADVAGVVERGRVVAPIGGVVADVVVTAGQLVEAFQPIAVIESMKVMTMVESPTTGRVTQIFVERGQRIEQGADVARVDGSSAVSSTSGSPA